jgi:hypothetical protein
LAPLRFATVTGHFRSSLHGKAYDAAGDVLPWYSYPMIDLLSQISSGIWRRALDAMVGTPCRACCFVRGRPGMARAYCATASAKRAALFCS